MSQWIIRGNSYRLATSEEIRANMTKPTGAMEHVKFACLCGHGGTWMAKDATLNPNGTYNGCRNIFYCYDGANYECSCPGSNLRHVVEGY